MPGTWQSIKELHVATTRGAKEGLAFRYFSRPLASFILWFIKDGRITPNQVTILSLAVGVLGSVVHVTVLSYAGLVLGGALFMLAHVLDALDGQLARHRKAGSVVGMYFDFFIDELKAYLMFVALGFRLYRMHDGHLWWTLSKLGVTAPEAPLAIMVLGFAGLATGISCTQFLKRPEWKQAFPPAAGSAPPSPLARLVAAIEKAGRFVVDYPSYIIVLCLLNRVDLYFLAYTLVVCLYALRTLATITLKLWRVDPYGKARVPDAPRAPAGAGPAAPGPR